MESAGSWTWRRRCAASVCVSSAAWRPSSGSRRAIAPSTLPSSHSARWPPLSGPSLPPGPSAALHLLGGISASPFFESQGGVSDFVVRLSVHKCRCMPVEQVRDSMPAGSGVSETCRDDMERSCGGERAWRSLAPPSECEEILNRETKYFGRASSFFCLSATIVGIPFLHLAFCLCHSDHPHSAVMRVV